MKYVQKGDNELYWKDTRNTKLTQIAINKTNKTIVATITLNQRGKIYFLPKPTKIKHSKAIELLIDLPTKKETKKP